MAAGRRSGVRHLAWILPLLLPACTWLFSSAAAGNVRNVSRPHSIHVLNPNELSGPISAPGGPYLRDRFGRIVILHGVNAVYKRPPYELFPAPGEPYDFSARDAARISALGFNVVRLGIIWEGLEPGTDPPNDPGICSPGPPVNPHQFNASVADNYLRRVKETVDLLGSYHIYSLLDMHQDIYSSVFGGEGAPPWAVCTNGLPIEQAAGRWSNTYLSPGLQAAFGHFWNNDVRGDLQGEYDRVWAFVARYFQSDPWVLGYDPMNEPFSTSYLDEAHHLLDAQIECFYTGRVHPGRNADLHQFVSCPPSDPTVGVIPEVERADRHHLVFYEPDIYSKHGSINYIGPIDLPRLVFNFHAYCRQRSGVTGDPTETEPCIQSVLHTMTLRNHERPDLGAQAEPGGPPLFMSEFGASGNVDLVSSVAAAADRFPIGWTYWSWKYYGDPTGSSDEALVDNTGSLKPTALALAQPYPEALTGRPVSIRFDPATGTLHLAYRPTRTAVPTIVVAPSSRYPNGYCARVTGARLISKPNASLIELLAMPSARRVSLRVIPGRCGPTLIR